MSNGNELYNIEDVAQIFNDSFRHVVGNQSEEGFVEILKFAIKMVGERASSVMLSPDNLVDLRNEVLNDSVIRDFVFALQFTFLGRWLQGRGQKVLAALVEDLATAVSHDMSFEPPAKVESGLNFLPQEVRDSLVTYQDGVSVLKANPWIMVLLLMQLFINLEDLNNAVSPPAKK